MKAIEPAPDIHLGGEEHIGVIGQSRSGKTTFVRDIVLSWFLNTPGFGRVWAIDTEERGEFPESDGWKVMPFDSITPNNVELIKILNDGNIKFKWVTPFSTDTKGLEKNELLCAMILKYGTNIAIYYDEISDFCNTHWIGEQHTQLMRKSGKREINIIWSSQRIQMVHKDIFSQTHHLFVFFIKPGEANSQAVKQAAPFISENLAQIPYQSYRALYQGPSGKVVIVTSSRK